MRPRTDRHTHRRAWPQYISCLRVTRNVMNISLYIWEKMRCTKHFSTAADAWSVCDAYVLLPHGMRKRRSRFQRNQRSSTGNISYTGCQKGTKFGTVIVWSLLYITAEIGDLWRRGPRGAPKYWKYKHFCNAFLVHRLAERDEICVQWGALVPSRS